MTDQSLDTFIGECSACGKKVKLRSTMKGKKVKCKACRSGESEATDAKLSTATPEAPAGKVAPVKTPPTKVALERVGDEVSPDALLKGFQGSKVMVLILMALVFHVLVILGTSWDYLKDEFLGPDTSEMSKEDKVRVAIGEATSALSGIAEKHGLSLEDITEKFSGSGSRADKLQENAEAAAAEDAGADTESTVPEAVPEPVKAPEREESELEKNLPKAAKGPEDMLGEDDDMSGL